MTTLKLNEIKALSYVSRKINLSTNKKDKNNVNKQGHIVVRPNINLKKNLNIYVFNKLLSLYLYDQLYRYR